MVIKINCKEKIKYVIINGKKKQKDKENKLYYHK